MFWKVLILSWLYVTGVIITFLLFASEKFIVAKKGEEQHNFKTYVIFSLLFPSTWIMILFNYFRR